MSILKKIAAAGLGLVALAGAAHAEDRKFGYTWTVTGASDYIFRGISYTQNDPTVNSYLEFTYGIAYLGLWTSNIDNGSCDGCLGPVEQDVYVGIRPVTGPVNWDLGVLWYTYQTKGSKKWTDTTYAEFKASASVSLMTNLTALGTVYYTPDQDLGSTENVSVEGTLSYTLPAIGIFTPTVSGQLGYSNSGTNSSYLTGYWLGDDEYTYWNAGVKFAVEKFTFDFRYWDTNLTPVGYAESLADERFLFTASMTLP